jgi:hypothetical protein
MRNEIKSAYPPTIHLTKDSLLLGSNNNGDGKITDLSYRIFVEQRYLDVETQNTELSF